MPRRLRLCSPGVAQHIIQRGNNRQVCFCADEDYAAYAHWLREAAEKYQVKIHAWVFMTNHVHLLVTPQDSAGVSQMMQQLGRCYVRYFNRTYRRSGTLWEGRFKSCLVDSTSYLLRCYCYIELNPVRAAMVRAPSDYEWSSYRSNALGEHSSLLTPHVEYLALGANQQARLGNYRALFRDQVDDELLDEIRTCVNAGHALGGEKFKDEVEAVLGKKVRPGVLGRPRKMLL